MLRQVQIETGWVRGLPAADPRVTSYKGIPFAAPPVGENRWRAPQPAASWEGVRDCYTFGPIAMQGAITANPENLYDREWHVDPDIAMSEDCLYLNVWTPAKTADEKLPVYVWIYGGGLASGYTAEMEFDGERIARRGCIVVSMGYRVNVFGFLAHPEITAEAPEAPANFGLLDQQAAIAWTRRNIAAFGGDPENITIGGQSMGGFSAAAQIASPTNRGMFQKAIMESGYWEFFYTPERFGRYELADAEQAGVRLFEHLGVKTLAEARALDAFAIRDALRGYRAGPMGVVTDGKFLDDGVAAKINRSDCLHIPMLLGNTGPEFHDAPRVDSVEALEKQARVWFGDKAEEFLTLCRKNGGELSQMLATADFQSTELAAHALAARNEKMGSPFTLYYYLFDAPIPGWDNPGAFHSVDLWFFFESLAKCWRPFKGAHYDLARQMCNYWVNFIKTGDPNGTDADGTPMAQWTPLTVEYPYRMEFIDTPRMDQNGPSDVLKLIVETVTK